MRYAIVANPASGRLSIQKKHALLRPAAAVLGAEIHGLDTRDAAELTECARRLSGRCDVIVVAGGDGAFSDIVNVVDTTRTVMAFLPLGTGNALRSGLYYKGNLEQIALRIRGAKIRKVDLIDCDGKRRAFMASAGFDGMVMKQRDRYLIQGAKGFRASLKAAVLSYFRYHSRPTAHLRIDDTLVKIKKVLSVMVVKQPFYGFGLKVVPKARFDDGKLHILGVNSGLAGTAFGAATAFTGGNRIGRYWTGHVLDVILSRPVSLQIDGNAAWEERKFAFRVLPGVLMIKY